MEGAFTPTLYSNRTIERGLLVNKKYHTVVLIKWHIGGIGIREQTLNYIP
jgi:hypothetical protein